MTSVSVGALSAPPFDLELCPVHVASILCFAKLHSYQARPLQQQVTSVSWTRTTHKNRDRAETVSWSWPDNT